MNEARPCRRCSECPNSDHHWIEHFEEFDEGLEEGELIFDHVCKHCGLLGNLCEACDGSGSGDLIPAYVSFGEIVGPDCPDCSECHGAGCIASCLYSSEDDE